MNLMTDWDTIIETIKNKSCVLFLGPEICVTEDGQPLEEALLKYLDIDNNEDIVTYYEKDELFLFKDDPNAKFRSTSKIRNFYKQGFSCPIYSKIARIPFHLIISVTPDLSLVNIFGREKIPKSFAFYNKTESSEDVNEPTDKKPLLYNIFGCIEKDESLIFTHNDLYDYLFSLLGDKRLPKTLRHYLQEKAKSFIFLGFKFDKWYVQLLLRLLDLQNPAANFGRFASNKKITDEIQTFCINQFRIEFVEDKCEDFIEKLYNKCKAANILRETKISEVSIADQLEKYIEHDQISEALVIFKEFLVKSSKNEHRELRDDITKLMSRHNRLQRRLSEKIIQPQDAEVEENQIIDALIQIKKDVYSS